MILTPPLLDALQEAARASVPSSPTPFTVSQLGKSLFTLPFFSLVTAIAMARAVWLVKMGRPEARSAIDLWLYWGAFTFGVGLFHVFMSLTSTTWSIQLFGPIGPEQQWLVARSVMLAMIAGAYGLLVLLVTALGWLGLRRWERRETLVGV